MHVLEPSTGRRMRAQIPGPKANHLFTVFLDFLSVGSLVMAFITINNYSNKMTTLVHFPS